MPNYCKLIKYIDCALVISGLALVLFLHLSYSEQMGSPLRDWIVDNFYIETCSENAVTAMYLDFRVFDTILEALMLLVCIMEVITISGTDGQKRQDAFQNKGIGDKEGATHMLRGIRVSYPLTLLLGIYLILNGHISPGGGFQGGTILATLFISRYIAFPKELFNIDRLEKLEYILYLFIILVPSVYLFSNLQFLENLIPQQLYLILMNTLIGLKVCVGLTVIVNWFIYYEGAQEQTMKHEKYRDN
ncbi:MnhB domain-containing protein [Alkalibacterium sp. MB6]|uniref:MnhB domain-containing protein n=1 Tax=Alkalibacterium sp. MB6 TaxID=2081965 RepID=UPI00192A3D0D|nr:MnhB domain-containing protein [Alkalibacterium sp. MB6]